MCPTWQAKIDLMYFSCILYFFSFQVTQTASSSPDPPFLWALVNPKSGMLFFISLQLISGWPMPSLLWLVIVYLLSNYVFSAFMFVCLEENIVKPYPELHFNITNATPVQYHYLLSWSINCTLRMCVMIYMSNMCTFMMFKHLMKWLLFLVQDDCNNLCFRCW